ncbi:MAG: hypothetical protein AAB706_04370 [Patescibacteria group bacterium]
MDLLSDIVTAVQDDLTVGDESTLFSPTLIKRAINRAYRKAGALFPWSELMDAKKTSTQANQEYYDYPQAWRSNSIWKLTLLDSAGNDDRYGEEPDGSPLSFDDYLAWKEDNPDSTDKKWANQWRRYFIWPIPTTAGTNNISVWGQKVTDNLSSDSDTTIFSYSAFEGNEAIALETVAILKSKGEQEKSGEFRSTEAKQILAVYWGKIRREMAKYEKIAPFFYVNDFFGRGTSKDLTGKFDVNM